MTPTMRVLPPPSVGRCPPPRRHHAALSAAESEAAVEFGFHPPHPNSATHTPWMISELVELLTSATQLVQLTRGGALCVPHATYTASLAALESIGFWDAGTVGGGDEANTLLRLHYATGGAARTETIYEAFWVQPLTAPSLAQAVRQHYGRAAERAYAHIHLGTSLWRGWSRPPALKPCATMTVVASMLEPFLWLGGSFLCLGIPIAACASADGAPTDADPSVADLSGMTLLISAACVAVVISLIAEWHSAHYIHEERSVLDWIAAACKWLCAPLCALLFIVLPALSAHVTLSCHASKMAALERAAAAIDARRGPVATVSPARLGGLTVNGKLDMAAVRAAVDKEVADGSISQKDANLLLSMASAHNGGANLLDSLRLKGAAIASIFSSAGAPAAPATAPASPPAPSQPGPSTATDEWWLPRPRAGAPPPPPPPPRSEVLKTPPRPTSLASPRGGLALV